jgi:succinoglycan biosynthesis transport protein ExoP
VLLCVVIGIGAAAAYVFTASAQYQAGIQLFVSTPTTDTNLSNAFNGSQFGTERVKSYADIINTPTVTAPVISKLGLPYSTSTLAGEISASAPLDTVLVNVSVKDKSAQRAADIANAVGEQAVTAIGALETPSGGGTSPVRVSLVKRADVPGSPVSPKKKLDLGLGLLAGLVVGIAGALTRERLDKTIHGHEELDALLGAPTLGAIAYASDIAKKPLLLEAAPRSPQAEAFRQIRTNLRYVNVDDRPRSIVVTSPSASEGKTTASANLALALAESGQQVLLLDADLRKPRVASTFGVEGAVGLTTVLAGEILVEDAVQAWGGPESNLWILPSGSRPPNPSELLGSAQMIQLLRRLERAFDYVVVDSAPLLPVTDGAILAAVANACVLVVAHGRTHRDHVTRARDSLANVGATVVGAVLNMAPSSGAGGGYYYSSYYGDPELAAGKHRQPSPLTQSIPATTPAARPDDHSNVSTVAAPIDTPGIDTPGIDTPGIDEELEADLESVEFASGEFDGEHDTEEPAISLDDALSGARPAPASGLKRLAGRKAGAPRP